MKTAEVAIIFILGSLTLLVFILFLALILIEYRRRQVKHITETLELKHLYQNEVLQTRLEVQEQSFRYFSEEVHDNIAQMLSLARMKLYKTAGKTNEEQTRAGIEASNELLGKTLNDLRNLSHILNGALVSKIPLSESIEKELNYLRDTAEIKTQLAITGAPFDLPDEKKLLVFRIVQEATGNAIKHGKATEINISLAYSNLALVATITDNGAGFDTSQLTESKGLGLHNMQVRARMLGAFNLVSQKGEGTTITLKIPTNEWKD